MEAADRLALESAFAVIEYLKEFQECPERPNNWQAAIRNEDGLLELTNSSFRVIYNCKGNLEATISVYYSFDSDSFAYIEQNGNVKWVYGHFTSRKEVIVGTREEISSVLGAIY